MNTPRSTSEVVLAEEFEACIAADDIAHGLGIWWLGLQQLHPQQAPAR